MKIYLNDSFEFTEKFTPSFLKGTGKFEKVRIPHTTKEISYNYPDIDSYQMVSGYRTTIKYQKEFKDKRVFVNFDGAAHEATVYLNGKELGKHSTGYTAFKFELTDYLKQGNNLLVVKLDSRETIDTPPFGFAIDYLCYGGIYRDAYLTIEPKTFIEDAYIKPIKKDNKWYLDIDMHYNGEDLNVVQIEVFDKNKSILKDVKKNDNHYLIEMKRVKTWDIDNPYLYKVVLTMNDSTFESNIGFRTSEFKADGYYLNDKKVRLVGLDRHQAWPYVGYAMPDSMQREDVRILKDELSCNIVRTSHYPQSQAFIDECDKRGLLVFTEFPGWQHIGGEAWKSQALVNEEEMITQYRNHPSIILWGVRINESQDDDEFYTKTNALAHKLDPYRQTSGVRYLTGSSLLEDVYAHNDFSFTGDFSKSAVRTKKQAVKKASSMNKGYIISEYNGHMYPTKVFDDNAHRQLHALRHTKVVNDMLGQEDISGCIGWCMFDYNTHMNFGSGDKICYHGVMDFFRNPKLAASVYASQSDEKPILEIGSCMEIGEYPGGMIGDIWVFSNADSVKLYKNGEYVKEFFPNEKFKNLKHPPFLIDDLVGDLVKNNESYDEKTCDDIRRLLVASLKYGTENLPLEYKALMAKLMVAKHFTMDDASRLYGKYVSGWGGSSTKYKFEAIKNGKVVKTVIKGPADKLHLDAKVSSNTLVEDKSYDVAGVRLNILDENNNVAVYSNEIFKLSTSGSIELIGPDVIHLPGGMFGTYIKSIGKKGIGTLTIENERLGKTTIKFNVK